MQISAEQPMDPAERLSESAKRVLALAHTEARQYGHPAIGAVHLLLALLQEDRSITASILQEVGAGPEVARMNLGVAATPARASVASELGYSPKLRAILDRAGEAAQAAGASQVSTEHLLFGLAHDEDSLSARTSERLGVDFERVRERLLGVIRLPTQVAGSMVGDQRSPVTEEGRAAPDPAALVRKTVEALHAQFYEPVALADLFREAWEGAAAAVVRAGASHAPTAPAFPEDLASAGAVLCETFPNLQQLAGGLLDLEGLAAAAVGELLLRRRDGHTMLHRRTPWAGSSRRFGILFSAARPLSVVAVDPRGPAWRGGLRRDQVVLTINGVLATHLDRSAAVSLLDRRGEAINNLTVRDSGGRTFDVELRSDLPLGITTEILPGPFGLLRLDEFRHSPTETDALRAALTTFEEAGARGWIIDMRWNSGGGSVHLSRLLVDGGRLFSRHRHNDTRLADGTVLPRRVDIDADSTALPFQRPLVVLIGPASISGAESFAGPMQALGRATLIGERTGGACGAARSVELAPGWTLSLAAWETRFGPQEWALNRIGVTPDLLVRPTAEDEAHRRDPQLDAAVRLLNNVR